MTLQTERACAPLCLFPVVAIEPENQAPLLAFLRRFRTALPGKTVWCYTGFTLEELLGKSGECRACTPHTRELLGLIDILVDGRYEEELADITLAFRGSKNQRVLNLPRQINKQNRPRDPKRTAGAVFVLHILFFLGLFHIHGHQPVVHRND